MNHIGLKLLVCITIVASFILGVLVMHTPYFRPEPTVITTIMENVTYIPVRVENVTHIPVETVVERNVAIPMEVLSDPIRREQLTVIPGESIQACALRLRNYSFIDADFIGAVQRQVILAMHYKVYDEPRPINVAWQEKSGDCTDYSNIIVAMLDYGGIKAHMIHGYVSSTGKRHDRVEVTFYIDGTGVTINDFRYVGEGVW
jgi:hypothetical protein